MDRLGPASGLQLSRHCMRAGIVHHFGEHRHGVAGALVQRAKAVEHANAPLHHPLAPFLRKADGVGDDGHRQIGRELSGRAELSLGAQPVDDPRSLALHFVLERFERDRRQRPHYHPAQAVVDVAVTTQRIAAQHLVHVVVHHDAERRREGLPIPECLQNDIITGEGKHPVFFQPNSWPHLPQLAVQRPGVQQGLVGIRVQCRGRRLHR